MQARSLGRVVEQGFFWHSPRQGESYGLLLPRFVSRVVCKALSRGLLPGDVEANCASGLYYNHIRVALSNFCRKKVRTNSTECVLSDLWEVDQGFLSLPYGMKRIVIVKRSATLVFEFRARPIWPSIDDPAPRFRIRYR